MRTGGDLGVMTSTLLGHFIFCFYFHLLLQLSPFSHPSILPSISPALTFSLLLFLPHLFSSFLFLLNLLSPLLFLLLHSSSTPLLFTRFLVALLPPLFFRLLPSPPSSFPSNILPHLPPLIYPRPQWPPLLLLTNFLIHPVFHGSHLHPPPPLLPGMTWVQIKGLCCWE